MERRDSSEHGTGSTGNDTGNSTGGGSRNTGSSTGNSTGSSTRSCTRSTGTSTGSGSRNTLNGTGNSTGNSTGNNTGNNTGNSTGSGRAAPPGGAGRALLCLALLLALPPARALPTPARHSQPLARCLNSSWGLLEAANTSLQRLKERDILGFNCTFEEVDLQDMTDNQINTIRACTAEDPGPGNCPVLERSTFDEGKCLQGISEDLRAYRPHLSNLEDPQLLVALDALVEALGNCSGKDAEAPLGSGSSGSSPGPSLEPSPGSSSGSSPGPSLGPSLGSSSPGSPLGSSLGSSPGSAPGLGRTPFPQRMRLCSALLAFRIRSVTISRMLNFLSSL